MFALVVYFSLLVVVISQGSIHSQWKDCENYTASYCLYGKCVTRYILNEKINICRCDRHYSGIRCETRILPVSDQSITKLTTNVLNKLIKILDSKNGYNISIYLEILIIILISLTFIFLIYTIHKQKQKHRNGSIVPSSDEL